MKEHFLNRRSLLKGAFALGVVGIAEQSGLATYLPSAEAQSAKEVAWITHPERGPLSLFTEKTPEETVFIDRVLSGQMRAVDHSACVTPDWRLRTERALWSGKSGPIVVELQRRLAADGLYTGQIDGGFGPMTDSALKIFQQARGMAPTGATDELTWMHLNDWPRPPSKTVGQHILVDDTQKRLWLVGAQGETQYTGGIVNNSQKLAAEPADAGYRTGGFSRLTKAYSEANLPLPYAVGIERAGDAGRFASREIMFHGFPLQETAEPGVFEPLGTQLGYGLGSLGSTREVSGGCIRLSYMGAKIIGNASERYGYDTIELIR